MSSWVDTLAQRKARAAQPQEHARPLPGTIQPRGPVHQAPALDRNEVASMVSEEVGKAMAPVEDLLRQVLRVAGAEHAPENPPQEAAQAAEQAQTADHPHRGRRGAQAGAEQAPDEPA